ncbi:MAG: hypothetical protein OEY89_15150 [Gammaproteobacteria bacterium]|nr:hypothetical protein [Gammaproteobacteria bacterium]
MIRQLYIPTHKFVVVKDFKVGSNLGLKIGDKVDKTLFKGFHIRSLYQRRIVGVEGSDWANMMILASKNNLLGLKPEVADIKLAVSDKKKAEKESKQTTKKPTVAVPPDVKVD